MPNILADHFEFKSSQWDKESLCKYSLRLIIYGIRLSYVKQFKAF